jgi:transcriptional regulator with XRE-family HTH domain
MDGNDVAPSAVPRPDWGGVFRQLRRREQLSQRAFAERGSVGKSLIAKVERSPDGTCPLSLETLVQILERFGCRLAVVDAGGREIAPFDSGQTWRDAAGRRFPAHADLDGHLVETPAAAVFGHYYEREPSPLPLPEEDGRHKPIPKGKRLRTRTRRQT